MERLSRLLSDREKKGLYRTLRTVSSLPEGAIRFEGKEYINLSSNDYLGFSRHIRLKDAVLKELDDSGVSSSSSRLLSGGFDIHRQLEERIADFKNKGAGLVFNSGYQANVGIISSFCDKGDVIFLDRLSHASIVDGALLSGARIFRFLHNDLNHLEDLLKKERAKFGRALIVTEGVFSMDGDRALLKGIAGLKEKYNCFMMVDEAHSTGVFGANASGVVEEDGLSGSIELIMGTFSKALGSFGAYLACSENFKRYLVNKCRSFIYSTALPPALAAANLASLDLLKDELSRKKVLLDNACWFRNRIKEEGLKVTGCSQIVPLIVGDAGIALEVSRFFQDKGFWVLPVRPPTVPEGESRLRFSLTYNHSRETLDKIISIIKNVKKAYSI